MRPDLKYSAISLKWVAMPKIDGGAESFAFGGH